MIEFLYTASSLLLFLLVVVVCVEKEGGKVFDTVKSFLSSLSHASQKKNPNRCEYILI